MKAMLNVKKYIYVRQWYWTAHEINKVINIYFDSYGMYTERFYNRGMTSWYIIFPFQFHFIAQSQGKTPSHFFFFFFFLIILMENIAHMKSFFQSSFIMRLDFYSCELFFLIFNNHKNFLINTYISGGIYEYSNMLVYICALRYEFICFWGISRA